MWRVVVAVAVAGCGPGLRQITAREAMGEAVNDPAGFDGLLRNSSRRTTARSQRFATAVSNGSSARFAFASTIPVTSSRCCRSSSRAMRTTTARCSTSSKGGFTRHSSSTVNRCPCVRSSHSSTAKARGRPFPFFRPCDDRYFTQPAATIVSPWRSCLK